jgi:hypothetical protein
VTVGNLSVGADCTAKLDNCIVRSFQRSLGTTLGNATDICTIDATNGTYTAELNVIQSESAISISKIYKFNVYFHATANAWHRLIPLNNRIITDQVWVVEIRVNNGTTTLRLVRQSGSVASNIECILTVHQSRANAVTITPSNATATDVTLSSTFFPSTVLCQVNNVVGVGTDAPDAGSALTVNGNLMLFGTQSANVHNLVIRGSAIGNGVTTSVTTGSTKLVTSGGVHSYVSSQSFSTGNLTVTGRTTTETLHITGGQAYLASNMVLPQGCYINWNTTPGQGRVEMVNKYGSGFGGFYFYEHAGGGTATPIDDTTRILHFNASGMDVPKDVYVAQSQGVFSSTAGSLFYYRQLAQPCVWRGSFTFTPLNQNFASYSYTVTGGPYITESARCTFIVSNGNYGQNAGFFPMSAGIETLTSDQVTKIRVLYTCNNTTTATVAFAMVFTPK